MNRTIWTVIGANIALFSGVTSSPAFQELHHHWIFPVLAALLTIEWAVLTGMVRAGAGSKLPDIGAARSTVLSILAFLIVMGIVRHLSILACFGGCSLKLGSAAAIAAAVFLVHAMLGDEGFWSGARAQAVALSCLLWSAYLLLFWRGIGPARLEPGFLGAAVLLIAAGWRTPRVWIVGFGVLYALLLRRIGGEHSIIAADVAMAAAALWLVGLLSRPPKEGSPELSCRRRCCARPD